MRLNISRAFRRQLSLRWKSPCPTVSLIWRSARTANTPFNVRTASSDILEAHIDRLAATEWIRGWKQNNWIKKSDSKPVMHRDLMVKMDELQQKLRVRWVRMAPMRLRLFAVCLDLRARSFVHQGQRRSRSFGQGWSEKRVACLSVSF